MQSTAGITYWEVGSIGVPGQVGGESEVGEEKIMGRVK